LTSSRTRSRAIFTIPAVLLLGTLGAIAIPASASAATFAVTTIADAGAGSLRDAISQANANPGADTITFAVPANSIIQVLTAIGVTESLTVDGSGTAGLVMTGANGVTHVLFNVAPATAGQDFSINDVTFDGTAVAGPLWRGVAVNTGFGAPNNDKVRNLTLTRIIGRNVTGTLPGTVLRSFTSEPGGSVTIQDSTFTANSTSVGSLAGGGAVYVRGLNGTLTVTGSTFTSNSAISGGAIFLDGAGGGTPSASISSSTFTNNHATGVGAADPADGRGGAIGGNMVANVTISGVTFSGNTATADGGAVGLGALNGALNTLSIATSTFSGNDAHTGAGIFTATTLGTVSIDSSTFSGNTLSGGAGTLGNSLNLAGSGDVQVNVTSSTFDEPGTTVTSALAIQTTGTSSLTVAHSTIVGPGGVHIQTLSNSNSSVTHSILWSTIAASPDEALISTTPGANTIAVSWNLSSGAVLAQYAVGSGNRFGVTNFGLGTLASNGGPTMTRMPNDGGAAHNTGNPAVVGAPGTDQRGAGFTRIIQTIDIGAVERQQISLAATGSTISPVLPLAALLMLLLGATALLVDARRRRRSQL